METLSDVPEPEPPKPAETQKIPQPEPVKEVSHVFEEFLASATVKMLARQHSINLLKVKGTGKKGRILKEDIIHFVENREKAKTTQTKEVPIPTKME